MLRFAAFFAIALCSVLRAGAQQSELGPFSEQLAKKLHSLHAHRLAVPDCVGPDGRLTQLGVLIGDALSDSIQKADTTITLYPRKALRDLLVGNHLNVSVLDSEEGKKAFLKLTHNIYFAVCRLNTSESSVHVDTSVYSRWVNVNGTKKIIASGSADLRLTPEMAAAATRPPDFLLESATIEDKSRAVPASDMTKLAERLSSVLREAKANTVAVWDCCGILESDWDYRRSLGDALRGELSSTDKNMQISLYPYFSRILGANESEVAESEWSRRFLFKKSAFDAIAIDSLVNDGARRALLVRLVGKDGREFAEDSMALRPAVEFSRVAESPQAEEVFEAGENGIPTPKCLSCPHPDYTRSATENKTSGVVELKVWIDGEGRVIRQQTLRGLPHGLTDNALATVRSWRFAPARNEQGVPVMASFHVILEFSIEK